MLLYSLPKELIGLLFLVITPNRHGTLADPAVNVALQASFNAPPYILELLETAAEENSTAYFPLLDRIAEGHFANCNTDQELYHTFVDVLQNDGHILNADALSSFQFALSIHSAAPRIQAHYHFYESFVEPSLMVAQDAACPVWVYFDGKQYCSPALDRAQQDVGEISTSEQLPFDRSLGTESEPVSILYADISSPLFAHFHTTVSGTARSGQTSYRIRYRPSLASSTRSLAVNGYGVELALKRTDYIVIDDRNAEKESAEISAINSEGEAEDEDEGLIDLKPLSSKDLLGLGMKAGSFIMASNDPFETLVKVLQDFPKHSFKIAKSNLSTEFVQEHASNRDIFLPAGHNIIWMNGQQIQSRQMDPFALLEQLRRERSLVGNLRSLGLTGDEAVQLLSHSVLAESKSEADMQRYDYRDVTEGVPLIIWLNDIEKDKRYNEWPSHASALLQRTWPGQLPQVRRDIHNVVIPLDLADVKDIEIIVETLQMVVKRRIPIRFGFVPLLVSPEAIDQAKIVYHLWDTYGLGAVLAYLDICAQDKKGRASAQKSNFESAIRDRTPRRSQEASDFQAVLVGMETKSQHDDHQQKWSHVKQHQTHDTTPKIRRVEDVQSYLNRLGADKTPAPFFTNGVAMPRNDAWLQTMSQKIDMDLRIIQRQVYDEAIVEDTWLAGRFLENAATHRNALIVPEDESSIKIIDVASVQAKHQRAYGLLPRLPSTVSVNASDLFSPHLLLIADLDSEEGSKLLTEAVRFRRTNPEVDLVFVHNPGGSDYFRYSVILSEFIFADEADRDFDTDSLDLMLTMRDVMAFEGKLDEMQDRYSDQDVSRAGNLWLSFQPIIETLGLQPGQQALYLNGRVVGPIPKAATFTASDFRQLLKFELSKRLNPASVALTEVVGNGRINSSLEFAILSSTIALSSISDVPEGIFESAQTLRMDKFNIWEGQHTMIQTGDPDTSSIHLVASIDPTSERAQRWIAILKTLSELQGVYLKIFLNPKERMQELPVKRFYRYVLDAKPTFNEDGDVRRLRAKFDRLPREALLNLGLDVPPAWLVAPKESIHDLDNIKLSAVKDGKDVDAIYELEHILIEGHSRDVTVGPPPRGVQLLLGTKRYPRFADTIIMANLGYFQFKANPGYWNLQLQPGRSSKIFTIESAGQEGYNPVPGDESTDIALLSFQGKTLYPRLSRNLGQETEDVLEGSFRHGTPMDYVHKAGKVASSFLSSVGLTPAMSVHADINIFSVASGHLYERMLNIMMVSVMRHTKHTVKFWFIEQFLSPSFKASLPTIAKHFGFQYELITYKWPHWLRSQSEKQREIWGYKILFLDVLFPTSLEKVIFVDADQIVRTDMYDLIKFDLEGAPYGFTPMCDSRTSMEGFRFWKQGYWANFLRGLPYHISALYVVDLVKFRELAAGDRLRGQYQQLSADPGSLSNLDQDLPNHMQHVLKIKSLPQEWLWCETWCSDEALASARTIDLCNNPETKEPKLSRARRQVPEWNMYDEEIAKIFRETKRGGEVRGGVQEEMVQAEGKTSGENNNEQNIKVQDGEEEKEQGERKTRTKDEL